MYVMQEDLLCPGLESESTIRLVNNTLPTFKGRRQRSYLLIEGEKIAAGDVDSERTS